MELSFILFVLEVFAISKVKQVPSIYPLCRKLKGFLSGMVPKWSRRGSSCAMAKVRTWCLMHMNKLDLQEPIKLNKSHATTSFWKTNMEEVACESCTLLGYNSLRIWNGKFYTEISAVCWKNKEIECDGPTWKLQKSLASPRALITPHDSGDTSMIPVWGSAFAIQK